MQTSDLIPTVWWAFCVAQLLCGFVWVFALCVRLVRGVAKGGLE